MKREACVPFAGAAGRSFTGLVNWLSSPMNTGRARFGALAGGVTDFFRGVSSPINTGRAVFTFFCAIPGGVTPSNPTSDNAPAMTAVADHLLNIFDPFR